MSDLAAVPAARLAAADLDADPVLVRARQAAARRRAAEQATRLTAAEADLVRAAGAERRAERRAAMARADALDRRLQNVPYGSTRGAVDVPVFGPGPDLLAHLGQFHKSHPGDADAVGFHDELHRQSRLPVPHRHVLSPGRGG